MGNNWIIAGIIGLIVGAYLNYITTQKANKELFAMIKAEIDTLREKQQMSTVARGVTVDPEDAIRLNQLEGALAILEGKLR